MMYLFLSMLLAGALGIILFMFGTIAAGVIAFGIIGGCIFRGVFLLEKINKKLTILVPDKDKVTETYEKYMKEKI